MAANNLNEVFNFVHKFLNLRKNGDNATLSLQCQDGKVTINLQLHLPCHPPYYQPHPPPCPHPRSHHTPSRVRRTIHRANARAEKAANDALLPPPNLKASTTEQVVDDNAVQASENDAHDCEAEQASRAPTNLSPKIIAHSEQADTAGEHGQSRREAECQEQELQQRLHPHDPPLGRKQSNNGHTKEVDTEPHHNITVEEFSEMKEIMEEFKINFTNGLAESVREGVRDAFKPP